MFAYTHIIDAIRDFINLVGKSINAVINFINDVE